VAIGRSSAETVLQQTVAPVDTIQGHHPWPQYLGGPKQQILEPAPLRLHNAFHAGLDKIPELSRQTLGNGGFQALSAAERADVFRKFEAYTKAFDEMHGTNFWDAAVREGFPGH
jgi:hypothetical protein